MLFDESYGKLRKQSFFHFFFLFWWFLLTNRASKTLLHQLFAFTFVCLGKSHFIFLFLFSLVTLSGTNVKGMFCFQKVSCSFSLISAFLLLPQFIFHEWNWLYYFTKQKIWRSWYLTYWSNAYVIEWNRKIFYRLKNKAFCKRLKRWAEFLFFAQFYAVLNQKMFFSK